MTVNTSQFVDSISKSYLKEGYATGTSFEEGMALLCRTINDHISEQRHLPVWRVLPLPTGFGKTQGLIHYCSLLSEASPNQGMLLVTKFNEQAIELEKKINAMSDGLPAIAILSDNAGDITDIELSEHQILIVTHKRFSNSMEGIDSRPYFEWKSGERFIVIDETIQLEKPISVDLDELRIARASIPYRFECKNRQSLQELDKQIMRFMKIANKVANNKHEYIHFGYWRKKVGGISGDPDQLTCLVQELHSELNGTFPYKIGDIKAKRLKTVIRNFANIVQRQESYLHQYLGQFELVANRSLLPAKESRKAVILDATAADNIAYKCLGAYAHIIDPPSNIRIYSNVDLNITYGVPVSKGTLLDKGNAFILEIINSLKLRENAKVLFCFHKDVEEQQNSLLAKTLKAKYSNADITHWGAIDGKNDWKEFEEIVLLGLPYLGSKNELAILNAYEVWHTNADYEYLDETVSGHDKDCFEFPSGYYENVGHSHIITSVIQAINRIRCRNRRDEDGGGDSAKVHLFLKSRGKLEKKLLKSVKSAMQGINVIERDLKKRKLSKTEQAILSLLIKENKQEYLLTEFILKIEDKNIASLSTLNRALAKPSFLDALNENGYEYKGQKGKYNSSKFLKI